MKASHKITVFVSACFIILLAAVLVNRHNSGVKLQVAENNAAPQSSETAAEPSISVQQADGTAANPPSSEPQAGDTDDKPPLSESQAGDTNGKPTLSESQTGIADDKPALSESQTGGTDDKPQTAGSNNNQQAPALNIEQSPCDLNALQCTKELLLYLHETASQNKVIFGHENDTNSTVRPGILSDVEDLTGDISGLIGLDFIDLAYLKLDNATQSDKLENLIQVSLDGAERGALITLSAHMPNWSSSSIWQLEDGSYDFTHYSLNDVKNITDSCAAESLPSGKYNQIFNAYLDLIAEYCLRLQEEQIPILFRPFHEGNGYWFWWGTGTEDDTYIKLFRYTKDYLTSKDVHNLLYVYSPNGPITNEAEYMERYPGDDYVDIVAVDYYNGGYDTWPSQYKEDFFITLNNTCAVINNIAAANGKLPAISETGIWVMKEDYSGTNGLLESGNPMNDKGWYKNVGTIAIANNMPYYLVWINTDRKNFHVPFKYDDSNYHEMADDFIDFYDQDYSVFAQDVHFYERIR